MLNGFGQFPICLRQGQIRASRPEAVMPGWEDGAMQREAEG